MNSPVPDWIRASEEVRNSLAARRPIVALETTVITHGLPRTAALSLAQEMQDAVRAQGAVPAVIGVLNGEIRLGLSPDEIEQLAGAPRLQKLNRRDLGVIQASKGSGGTTVSATLFVARAAGIRVMATGGIGGVHRGEALDVSADLTELAANPSAVVCSGAKAVLDLPRTLEWLETAGVPVLGWGTDEFPAFFSRESGLPTSARVEDAAQAAAILTAHWRTGMTSGVLVCVPCPAESAIPGAAIQAALDQAQAAAEAGRIHGKALTPFLLARLVDLTGGGSLRANLALLRNNARVAGSLAVELARTGALPDV